MFTLAASIVYQATNCRYNKYSW